MKKLFTVIAILVVAITNVNAQSPRLELRRMGSQWVLDYQPSPQQGASILHFSTDLTGLPSSNAGILDVPATSALMPLDVTSLITGERGFFAVTELPGLSSTDFSSDDDDPVIIELPPAYTVETLTDMVFPLTSGPPLRLHFRLLDGTTAAPANINGQVSLELYSASGDPVSFAYILSPNTLPLTDGAVDGFVTITTMGDLTNVYIAVAEVTPVAAPRVMSPSAVSTNPNKLEFGSIVGIKSLPLSAYQNTATGLHYPLPVVEGNPLPVPKELAGSFGEYRISGNKERLHFGMDFITDPGTNVQPVKRGVVSHIHDLGNDDNGNWLGKYMIVVHGDGTASRYLHVVPNAVLNQVVETRTVIARTANITKKHLHLELRSGVNPAADYTKLGGLPGQGFDPGVVNASFDVPPIQPGVNDVNAPEIKALYVWGAVDPKTAYFTATPPEGAPNQIKPGETGHSLVALIVDKEGGARNPNSGFLVPAHIEFAAEDPATRMEMPPVAFDYNTEAEAKKLLQSNPDETFATFGYVRRIGLPLQALYQYWFKWDTSVYASQPLGPRQVRLSASDRAGHSTSQTYCFGPELIDPGSQTIDAATPTGTTLILTARSYMGPFPATQTTAPRDQLTFTFEGATASWDAFFLDPTAGSAEVSTLKRTFIGGSTGIKEDTIQVRVKKKAGIAIPTTPETLTLKVASGVFPSIAHTVNVTLSPGDPNFALIPAGSFMMGNSTDAAEGSSDELPVHTVYVSAFYMAKYEVTKALWDEVRTWAAGNGYSDLPSGGGKAADHPVHTITWYDMVKWCNARSQKDGLTPCYTVSDAIYKIGSSDAVACNWSASGYRLPTEAEWEKAARGGQGGQRFPWGAMINWSLANYFAYGPNGVPPPYDTNDRNATPGYHPSYSSGPTPYTSPVGSFSTNGYGLYDMAGNVWEWCWDWYGGTYDTSSAGSDPRGAASGTSRVFRGGGWQPPPFICRTASRANFTAVGTSRDYLGFRPARSSIP